MEIMIEDEIVWLIIATIIFLPPLWKIFKKAGFSPWGSLLVLIPPFGAGGDARLGLQKMAKRQRDLVWATSAFGNLS